MPYTQITIRRTIKPPPAKKLVADPIAVKKLLEDLDPTIQTKIQELAQDHKEAFQYLLRNTDSFKKFLLKHDLTKQKNIVDYLKNASSLNDIIKSSKILEEFGFNSDEYLQVESPQNGVIDLNYGKLDLIINHLKEKYRHISGAEKAATRIENKEIGDVVKLYNRIDILQYTILISKDLNAKTFNDTLKKVAQYTPTQKENFLDMMLFQEGYSPQGPLSSKHPVIDLFDAGFNETQLINMDNKTLKVLLTNSQRVKQYLNTFLDKDKPAVCLKLESIPADKLLDAIPNNFSIETSNPSYHPLPENDITPHVVEFLRAINFPEHTINEYSLQAGFCLSAALKWISSGYLKQLSLTTQELNDVTVKLRDDIDYIKYCDFLLISWCKDNKALSEREEKILTEYIDKLLFLQMPTLSGAQVAQDAIEFSLEMTRGNKLIHFEKGDMFYIALNEITNENALNIIEGNVKSLKDGFYLIQFENHAAAVEVVNGEFKYFDPSLDTLDVNKFDAKQFIIQVYNSLAFILGFSLDIMKTAVITEISPKQDGPKNNKSTLLYFDKGGYQEAILFAFVKNDVDTFSYLLEKDPQYILSTKSNSKFEILPKAIAYTGHYPSYGKILDIILKNKHVNINTLYKKGCSTPLISAIESDPEMKLGIIEKILNHKDGSGKNDVDPNIKTIHGGTAIMYAIACPNSKILDKLFELHNIDLNIIDDRGTSPFGLAIMHENLPGLAKLLNYANRTGQPITTTDLLNIINFTSVINDNFSKKQIFQLLSPRNFITNADGTNLFQEMLLRNYPLQIVEQLLIYPISKLHPFNTKRFLNELQSSLAVHQVYSNIKLFIAHMIVSHIHRNNRLSPTDKLSWLQDLKNNSFFTTTHSSQGRFSRADAQATQIFDKAIQQIASSPSYSNKRKLYTDQPYPEDTKRRRNK